MSPKPTEPVVFYTSAFRSSDCCEAPFWRFCFADGQPEQFVCRACWNVCSPAPATPLEALVYF